MGANRPIVIDNPDSETPAISVPKYNLIAQIFSYGKDDYKSIIGINYNGCDYYKSGFTESLWECSGKEEEFIYPVRNTVLGITYHKNVMRFGYPEGHADTAKDLILELGTLLGSRNASLITVKDIADTVYRSLSQMCNTNDLDEFYDTLNDKR